MGEHQNEVLRTPAAKKSALLIIYEEKLATRRTLGQSRSDQSSDRIADAETLASVADLRFELGKNEVALTACSELIPMERDLLASDSSDRRWQWNLSCTLFRVGDLRLGLGHPKGALSAFQ